MDTRMSLVCRHNVSVAEVPVGLIPVADVIRVSLNLHGITRMSPRVGKGSLMILALEAVMVVTKA